VPCFLDYSTTDAVDDLVTFGVARIDYKCGKGGEEAGSKGMGIDMHVALFVVVVVVRGLESAWGSWMGASDMGLSFFCCRHRSRYIAATNHCLCHRIWSW